MYIFLDESGQFVKHNDEQYFVIGSFTVGNPRRTEKKFRSWQRSRFPRKMKSQAEIKFSEVKIDDELRLKTLKMISTLDVRIKYSYLKRENIPENFRNNGKIDTGILYTQVVGKNLELYANGADNEFIVRCDQRHLKGSNCKEFSRVLNARLLPLLPKSSRVEIKMVDSTTNPNVQIADWISGALARYHEGKPLGKESYEILGNNIIESEELFKDYWEDKQRNKKLNHND